MKLENKKAWVTLKAQIRKMQQDNLDCEREQDAKEAQGEIVGELLEEESQQQDEEITDEDFWTAVGISQDEIMTRNKDGSPLCVFRDNTWFLVDKTGDIVTFRFGQSETRKYLDFTDPLAAYFLPAQKLFAYSIWPKKNPTEKPLAANTVRRLFSGSNYLFDWLYKQGILRSDDPSIPPSDIGLITAKVLQKQIERLLDEKAPYSEILIFIEAIRRWCSLGRKPFCPDWFQPTFTYREVITLDLADRVGKYYSENRGRWRAIDFDDLQPMLITAKYYLDIYSEDLFWLEDRVADAHTIHLSKGIKKAKRKILNGESTKHLFNQVVERTFAIAPDTGLPWFEVSTSSRLRDVYILRQPIYNELGILIGAAVFIILIFTGLRHQEALHLSAFSLEINGKPLDFSGDVIAQVEEAGENSFDLIRPLFKTDPYGRDHKTPIPKIAAKAFAVLSKVLAYARKEIDTDFLFPTGGAVGIGNRPIKVSRTKNRKSITRFLKAFCQAVGVDYQHPHRCRKSLATLIINHDSKSLEVIRYLLGHKSVAMTMEYIMALPGINDELLAHFEEAEFDKITEWIADALEGFVAGPIGDHTLNSIDENIEKWQGHMLPFTIREIIKSMEGSGISIHRTPAVWCIWFDIRVPRDAPCLDLITRSAIAKGKAVEPKDYFPDPEFCVPYECGYAGHSRSNLPIAKRALRYAKEQVTSSRNRVARAHFSKQVLYWENVVCRLENGHSNFVNRGLLEEFITGESS